MRELGCACCKTDADVWFKEETRPGDGFECHSCMLCYVDDVLCMHHNAMKQIQRTHKQLPLKEGSAACDPDAHLGAKLLRKVMLENGVKAWSMSPGKHVQEVMKNVENYLQEKETGRPWLKKAPTPFAKDCRPEINILPELGAEDATCCLSQIRVLCWMVKLGRADIITGASMLASQLA
jgi:hypothetical protein